jgi:hypothetical protein
VARFGGTEGVYGVRYLTAVAIATAAVTSIALLVRNREAALGAAVLGIYALHLLSVRYVLRNQRRHQDSLLTQLDLLHRLVDPAASPADAEPHRAAPSELPAAPGPAPERSAARAVPTGAAPAPAAPPRRAAAAAGNGDAPERPAGRTGADETSTAVAPPAVQPGPAPAGGAEPGEIPIPRHFALGTVALIRQLLTPAEVAHVLIEQRKQPDRRFATLAVEMGLLTDAQREELLLAQQEGLFTEQEMREARERLREFRESTAKAMSDMD